MSEISVEGLVLNNQAIENSTRTVVEERLHSIYQVFFKSRSFLSQTHLKY